ncbi:MAG TPA: PHB depolymerase family esterase, partial [Propylenella sp.]|nr:PHB depolymerase family esterase [Propylenella sp.]
SNHSPVTEFSSGRFDLARVFMAGLKQTTADLAQHKRRFEQFSAGAAKLTDSLHGVSEARSPLREVEDFGANPGELRMLTYVPEGLPAGAPLVVALHGCTQTAAGFDRGTGWSALADRYQFALLLPEQQQANNQNGCFNWFLPGDTRRDRGEVGSIRAMIERLVRDEQLDERRVFVTGLSAGGAMASAMLATYPEVFAGGAIIAGLPYGAAANVQQALECMHKGVSRPAAEWGLSVRRASRHKGPWPKISVWHGAGDAHVQPSNAGEIVKQWTELHGLPLYPSEAELTDAFERRIWRSPEGEPMIESYLVTGMAHGVPIAAGAGDGQCGVAAPFMLDVGVSSGHRIVEFWGLSGDPVLHSARPRALQSARTDVVELRPVAPTRAPEHRRGSIASDPGATIERALRAAGLMKP